MLCAPVTGRCLYGCRCVSPGPPDLVALRCISAVTFAWMGRVCGCAVSHGITHGAACEAGLVLMARRLHAACMTVAVACLGCSCTCLGEIHAEAQLATPGVFCDVRRLLQCVHMLAGLCVCLAA